MSLTDTQDIKNRHDSRSQSHGHNGISLKQNPNNITESTSDEPISCTSKSQNKHTKHDNSTVNNCHKRILIVYILSSMSLLYLILNNQPLKPQNLIQRQLYLPLPLNSSSSIPKKIYFTYKNKLSDTFDIIDNDKWKLIKNNIAKISKMNPEFEIKYFSDDECYHYIKQYNDELANYFQSESHGAFKADIFRLVVLYFDGGYYLDVDLDMKLSIDQFINNRTLFTTVVSNNNKEIFQAFLGSIPKHPIIGINIQLMLDYYRGDLDLSAISVTISQIENHLGPVLMSQAIKQYTNLTNMNEINNKFNTIQLFWECTRFSPKCPAYYFNYTMTNERQFIVYDKMKTKDIKHDAIIPFWSRITNAHKWYKWRLLNDIKNEIKNVLQIFI